MLAQGINGAGSAQLDSWIAIGADGTVTAYTGKCEFGQGLYTAQMQLVAEELSVPFERVRLIQCDTSMTPDQGTTSGQQSHPANFNRANLALAAATARETLVRLASARLGVGAAGSRRGQWRGQRAIGAIAAGHVRRAGRRTTIRGAARPNGGAQASSRVEGARHVRAARGHAAPW